MHCWDDGPDDYMMIDRDYELLGVAGLRRGEPGNLVRKLRSFDHFTAIVGKGREDAGTQPLMESANMRIRTYNMQDEQFAFIARCAARRCGSSSAAMRSISPSSKTSKFPRRDHDHPAGHFPQRDHIPPEDENFLRLNFYSKVRWRVPIDPTKHYFDSKFEIKTTVHKQAEWRKSRGSAVSPESHEVKV